MKKNLLIVLSLFAQTFFAQNPSDVFTSDTLVYYGIDFSNCRLIGDFGNGSGANLRDKMFPAWNDIFLSEREKYDINKFFKKEFVYYDLKPVATQNAKTDENNIRIAESNYSLNPSLIPEMVAAYQGNDRKKGVGLVFIVDNYDKNRELGFVYVTFFDIASKKILFSEELKGMAGGFSLRNFWSQAIYDILKQVKGQKYYAWEKKYNPKR